MKFLTGITLISLLTTLISCSIPVEPSSPSSGPLQILTKFDLGGSKGLVVIPASSIQASARAVSSVNKIFKVTDSGAFLEVTALDQDGISMTTTLNPQNVVNAGNEYLMFRFGSDDLNTSAAYLVRKSDGAVFEIPSGYLPDTFSSVYKNHQLVQSDSAGYLYFTTRNNNFFTLTKIDTTVPSNLTAETISPSTDSVYGFLVSPDGDIVYQYYGAGGVLKGRIQKRNGGLINLPATINGFFVTSSGDLLYFDSSTTNTVHIADDGTVTTTPASVALGANTDSNQYLVAASNEQYIIGSSGISRVESSTKTLGNVTGSGISAFNLAASSGTKIFVAGNDTSGNPLLVSYNPSTDAFFTLLPSTDGIYYDIYSMDVSADNSVLFNALRMSDGKKVIGTVSSTGLVSIVDSTYNTTLVSLVQIK